MGEQEKFESWAIVELMGHRRIAGRVTEQTRRWRWWGCSCFSSPLRKTNRTCHG